MNLKYIFIASIGLCVGNIGAAQTAEAFVPEMHESLEQGIDVNSPIYDQGKTLLHRALELEAFSAAKLLINSYAAGVNAEDDNGTTPLIQACLSFKHTLKSKYIQDIYVLFQRARSKYFQRLFAENFREKELAKFNGLLEVIDLLIEKGANVNHKSHDASAPDGIGFTPLVAALKRQNGSLMLHLISKGASLDLPEMNEQSLIYFYPIFFIAEANSKGIIPDIAQGNIPHDHIVSHYGIFKDWTGETTHLVKHEQDPEKSFKSNMSPILLKSQSMMERATVDTCESSGKIKNKFYLGSQQDTHIRMLVDFGFQKLLTQGSFNPSNDVVCAIGFVPTKRVDFREFLAQELKYRINNTIALDDGSEETRNKIEITINKILQKTGYQQIVHLAFDAQLLLSLQKIIRDKSALQEYVNYPSKTGLTLLYLATKNGNETLVNLLLSLGVEYREVKMGITTAYEYAFKRAAKDKVYKNILFAFNEEQIKRFGYASGNCALEEAFEQALSENDLDKIQDLLQNGYKPSPTNLDTVNKMIVSCEAIEKMAHAMVKKLKKKTADAVDQKYNTLDIKKVFTDEEIAYANLALFKAIEEHNMQDLESAIQAGASIDAKNKENNSALWEAVNNYFSEGAIFLIDLGASLTYKNNNELSVFELVFEQSTAAETIKSMKTLLAKTVNCNAASAAAAPMTP